MPPKKQKPTEDIRSYFNKEPVSPGGSSSTESSQPGEASTSQMAATRQVKMKKEEVEEKEQKEEDDAHSKGRHSHQFTVKFPNEDVEYTIDCDQPRTVLDVIKLDLPKQFQRMTNKDNSDSKIIIQLSKKGRESIVATHFPCCCIENNECLVIHCKTEEVQETKSQHDKILPRDEYSVFYIATQAGKYTKKLSLFKRTLVKEFDYLCVYAKKGTSVKEALERDGRFVDLDDFELSEVENSTKHTLCTQKVDNLNQKKFKICRDRRSANRKNDEASSEQQEQPSTSKQSKQKVDIKSVLVEAQKSGISVKKAMEEKGREDNTEENEDLLCKQVQDLKVLTESKCPGDSYQKALELKKEKLNIVSWNVRGRLQTERVAIMDYASELKADILLLQETHLSQSEEESFSDPNYNVILSSCSNRRQRGVSILVHNRIPFTLNHSITDSEGRYIIIQATIFNKLYTVANLYAPNNDDPAFFRTIFSHLKDLSANSTTIIGGDFNVVLNPSVDRSSSPKHAKQSQSVKIIHDYMKDFGLVDVWRLKNPTKREYTFFSSVHQTSSRIDFFLVSNSIAHEATTEIHPIIISDHAPISLSLPTDSIPEPPQN